MIPVCSLCDQKCWIRKAKFPGRPVQARLRRGLSGGCPTFRATRQHVGTYSQRAV